MKKHLSLLTAVLGLTGCDAGIHGYVFDVATERSVANAKVTLTYRGWGMSAGSLIWDKDYALSTETDPAGRFGFSRGGLSLLVSAQGYADMQAGLCPRSPTTVWIGAAQQTPPPKRESLLVGITPQGAPLEWDFRTSRVTLSGGDFSISNVPTGSSEKVRYRAPLGLAFKGGRGAIPSAPRAGYARQTGLGELSACGWLYVRHPGGLAAIDVGAVAIWENTPLKGAPEGSRFVHMDYHRL